MHMMASCRVLKAMERRKSELYTKCNEKSLVSIKKGGDMVQFTIYFGCCLEKRLE